MFEAYKRPAELLGRQRRAVGRLWSLLCGVRSASWRGSARPGSVGPAFRPVEIRSQRKGHPLQRGLIVVLVAPKRLDDPPQAPRFPPSP